MDRTGFFKRRAWLWISAIVGALAIAGFMLLGGEGVHTVYVTSSCGELKIAVWAAYYHHHIERGDEYGYGLTLAAPGHGQRYLYLGGQYHGDLSNLALSDFAPLPPDSIGMPKRIFELPDKTYDRNAVPSSPRPHEPPVMNIFLDPRRFDRHEFEGIADCLKSNREEINKVLAHLGTVYPTLDQKYYDPLRLGGVVYGKPPYDDPRHVAAIHTVWGIPDPPPAVIPLPEVGRVTVLPGQRAEGTIDGFKVAIWVPPEGGEPVKSIDPPLQPKPPFIVNYISRHSDKSATFSIAQRGADGLYRE